MHYKLAMRKFNNKKIIDNPSLYLALGFLSIILFGSFLLYLPISSNTGTITNYLDCLFVATSNVCVTGLTTVVTSEHWSGFGQVVIIVLIQIGGLGFMTMATLMAMILGKRITLSSRLVIKEQLSTDNMKGLVKLVRYVIISTIVIELVGATLLSIVFIPEFGAKGIWYGIFHSISAFCNAGFDIIGATSLMPYNHNVIVMLTISFLIILGGLGFNVYLNITQYKLNFNKYSLHSKIVLISTTILLILSGTLIFIFEYSNIDTLKNFDIGHKILNSFFQSVTLRTAGYFSIDQASLKDSSVIISIITMFIGGAPASTAGGLKISTFALFIITAISEIRGNDHIEIFKRTIKIEAVKKATTIAVIFISWILLITVIMVTIEPFSAIDILFEVVSAAATVGLTRNLTPNLTDVSKMLLIITMYMGRVGMLTLIFAFSRKKKKKQYIESYGNIILG